MVGADELDAELEAREAKAPELMGRDLVTEQVASCDPPPPLNEQPLQRRLEAELAEDTKCATGEGLDALGALFVSTNRTIIAGTDSSGPDCGASRKLGDATAEPPVEDATAEPPARDAVGSMKSAVSMAS